MDSTPLLAVDLGRCCVWCEVVKPTDAFPVRLKTSGAARRKAKRDGSAPVATHGHVTTCRECFNLYQAAYSQGWRASGSCGPLARSSALAYVEARRVDRQQADDNRKQTVSVRCAYCEDHFTKRASNATKIACSKHCQLRRESVERTGHGSTRAVCSQCHTEKHAAAFPRLNGKVAPWRCVKCRSLYVKQWQSEHPEMGQKRANAKRARRGGFSVKSESSIKAMSAATREAWSAWVVETFGSHDAFAIHKKESRAQKHRERTAAWAARNPDKIKEARERRGRADSAQRRVARARRIAEAGGICRVYFFQEDGPDGYIKIGYTEQIDVRDRLDHIQTGNARKVNVIGVMPGTRLLERALHDQFASSRCVGEWFEPAPDLLALITLKSSPWNPDEAKEAERVGEREAATG